MVSLIIVKEMVWNNELWFVSGNLNIVFWLDVLPFGTSVIKVLTIKVGRAVAWHQRRK